MAGDLVRGRGCVLLATLSPVVLAGVVLGVGPAAAKRRSRVPKPPSTTTTTVVTPTPKAGSGAPVRYSTFWDFCENRVPVTGAAAYAGKAPHPIIFSIQQTYSTRFTADSHYLGNAAFTDVDPPRFQLVGCLSRTNDGAKLKTCAIQLDSVSVDAPMFEATYRLDVFEAATARQLVSMPVPSLKQCPLVVALDPKQPKIFAPPADAVISKAVLPLVRQNV